MPTARGERAAELAFWDESTGCTVGLHRPFQAFDLWQAYVLGARESYRRHGVEQALMVPPATPDSISPFFVVIRQEDEVVAGFQVNGPLVRADQARALVEFAADPGGVRQIREQVERSLPEGVIEFKAAWVQVESPLRRELAALVARCFVHTLRALALGHGFCTAATHAAGRWKESGGTGLPGLEPTVYPDERYSTTLLWWRVADLDDVVPAIPYPERSGNPRH